MCHLNTVNIPKHEGVNEWAHGKCNQKPPTKYHEMKGNPTFASSKANSDNAKKKEISPLASITI